MRLGLHVFEPVIVGVVETFNLGRYFGIVGQKCGPSALVCLDGYGYLAITVLAFNYDFVSCRLVIQSQIQRRRLVQPILGSHATDGATHNDVKFSSKS